MADEQVELRKQYGALVDGLETRSATKANAAIYIAATLDGGPLSREDDEFYFRWGYGVTSETFQYSPQIWDLVGSDEVSEYTQETRIGEVLSDYDQDELGDLAAYLYADSIAEDGQSLAVRKRVDRLSRDPAELDAQIAEITSSLEN